MRYPSTFVQPLSRIAALTLSAVAQTYQEMVLLLGPDRAPVLEPLAALLARYLVSRFNTNTTNTATSFLFPGRRSGPHITASQLRHHLRQLGITGPERQGRVTHLVNKVPVAIVAQVPGYAPASTASRQPRAGPTGQAT